MTEVEKNSLDIMWRNTQAWYEWVDDCIKDKYCPYQTTNLYWNILPWKRGLEFWSFGKIADRSYFNKIFTSEIIPIIDQNFDELLKIRNEGKEVRYDKEVRNAVSNLIAFRYKDWKDNISRRSAKILSHTSFTVKWPSDRKILEKDLFSKYSSMIWKEFSPNSDANRFTLKEDKGVEQQYSGDFWVEVDECTILCVRAHTYLQQRFEEVDSAEKRKKMLKILEELDKS